MFLQSADIFISSGISGTSFLSIDKSTNISISYSIPRQDANVIGNSRPISRPIINYIPVKYSLDYTKNDKEVENSLGILNPTGVAYQLGKSNSIIGYGCRDLQVLPIDKFSNQYSTQINISSGVLQTYHLATTIGQPAKATIALEGVSLQVITNTSVLNSQSPVTNIIKSENTEITGISFSGFGITGISIQEFNLDIGFTRQATMKLGYQFPEYKLQNAKANISINGYIEGFIPTSGTQSLLNGLPETGTYYITLQPGCSNYPATTYIMVNPYLETFSLGVSIGQYFTTQLSFSIPLPFTSQECSTGSNLIII